jgi:hypothetical protein
MIKIIETEFFLQFSELKKFMHKELIEFQIVAFFIKILINLNLLFLTENKVYIVFHALFYSDTKIQL